MRRASGVGLGDGVGGDAGEAVEEDALLGLVEAGEGFSLGVDEGEFGGELPKDGDGGGLVVDEDAALAGGEDFAAEDDFAAFGVDAVFFEDGFGAGSGLERRRRRRPFLRRGARLRPRPCHP